MEEQMTEAEWLSCNDPQQMLEFLQDSSSVSQRKLRLFAAACCRRIWPLLADIRSRTSIEVAEHFADGQADKYQLKAACKAADKANAQSPSGANFGQLDAAAHVAELDLSCSAADAASTAADAASKDPIGNRMARVEECRQQARLLREIFGLFPFHPFPRLPAQVMAWNDGCVVKLATAIYDERDFTHDRMGVLADALEEAGLEDREVLSHCRQEEAVHVRGCWCVDLLLGKS
jgi:hypothetical protein